MSTENAGNLANPKDGDQVTVMLLESDDENMADAQTVYSQELTWLQKSEAFVPSGEAKGLSAKGRLAKASDDDTGDESKSRGGGAEVALAVGKQIWTMIKENKPDYQGEAPSTYVLHPLETNGLSYSEAKPMASKWYEFIDKNWTGAVMDSFKFRVYGLYQAKPPSKSKIPNGSYIPNLSVQISKVQVYAANWLDVDISLGNPGNVGTEDDVNPYVNLAIGVKSSGWFQTHKFEYAFSITGRGGVKYLGCN